MARDGKNVKDLKMPRSLKKGLKEPSAIGNPLTKDGAPTLMGNIGPTKNKYLDPVSQMDLDHKQSLMAELQDHLGQLTSVCWNGSDHVIFGSASVSHWGSFNWGSRFDAMRGSWALARRDSFMF